MPQGYYFVRFIDTEGTQGSTCLLKNDKGEKIVCKFSHHRDYVIRHEAAIMEKLKGLSPHFSQMISFTTEKLTCSWDVSPFEESKVMIPTEILLQEYISFPRSVNRLVRNIPTKKIDGIIRQTLIAIEIGQRKAGLIHYDLHTDNILIRKCPETQFNFYDLGERQFLIPTFGYVPVIIDFGFSYIKGMTGPFYCTTAHTDSGHLGCIIDPYCDARVFLYNITDEMVRSGMPKEVAYRKRIEGIYAHLNLHPKKGWEPQNGQYNPIDVIDFSISEENSRPHLVRENSFRFSLILQSLVTLPLVDRKDGDFMPWYRIFALEFRKLELTVKTSINRWIILNALLDSVRTIRDTNGDRPINESIREFRRCFSEEIDKSLSFYMFPKDIDYDQLYIATVKMGECLRTVYYRIVKDISARMKKKYTKSEFTNLDLVDLTEGHFDTAIEITTDSVIERWSFTGSDRITDLTPEQCRKINRLKGVDKLQMIREL